ncbi:hypothetical protein LPTSP4_28330 [Leptospira ryugenii]|uniref:Uncharacterized protein n=1 Tax=Leptospira ryugenii TaxID=1917863 RepID=A0A2P2E358_9LEPT|nr:hypothetical protein [Leptospira ryugenii]GBF51301.1 hypothetical protein LPTSP4_28330 [Leptospira ryugenii]
MFACLPELKKEWNRVQVEPVPLGDENRLKLISESIWLDFPKSKHQCSRISIGAWNDFGVQGLFCHFLQYLQPKSLRELLHVPIYVDGPHSENLLNLTNKKDFGRYHPEFPKRLLKYFLPAKENTKFRLITQLNYDTYLRRFARTFYVVHRKFHSDLNFFEKEVNRYEELLSENRLEPFYLEKFRYFMYPDFTDSEDIEESAKFFIKKGDELYDSKLVMESVGFWIRRTIDGTDQGFYQFLLEILQTYDSEFLRDYQ